MKLCKKKTIWFLLLVGVISFSSKAARLGFAENADIDSSSEPVKPRSFNFQQFRTTFNEQYQRVKRFFTKPQSLPIIGEKSNSNNQGEAQEGLPSVDPQNAELSVAKEAVIKEIAHEGFFSFFRRRPVLEKKDLMVDQLELFNHFVTKFKENPDYALTLADMDGLSLLDIQRVKQIFIMAKKEATYYKKISAKLKKMKTEPHKITDEQLQKDKKRQEEEQKKEEDEAIKEALEKALPNEKEIVAWEKKSSPAEQNILNALPETSDVHLRRERIFVLIRMKDILATFKTPENLKNSGTYREEHAVTVEQLQKAFNAEIDKQYPYDDNVSAILRTKFKFIGQQVIDVFKTRAAGAHWAGFRRAAGLSVNVLGA